MFSNKDKMAKSNDSQPNTVNLICDGTIIKGDIEANKDIRIDGFVNGTLNVKGKVVVGITGRVEGEIRCETIDISGVVEGNINTSDMVSMQSSANVKGNITTGKIAVEPGAIFTGSCKMGKDKNDKKEKK